MAMRSSSSMRSRRRSAPRSELLVPSGPARSVHQLPRADPNSHVCRRTRRASRARTPQELRQRDVGVSAWTIAVLRRGPASAWHPSRRLHSTSPKPSLKLHVETRGKKRKALLHNSFDVAALPPSERVARSKRNRGDVFPTKSRTVKKDFPLQSAQATSNLFEEQRRTLVGRSMNTVSTAGMSTPSLKRSTERRRGSCRRRGLAVPPAVGPRLSPHTAKQARRPC